MSRDIAGAAEALGDGVGVGQIIVALIGGLALILVALIPVLITSAKRGASTTTPSPPAPAGSTISPEEVERLWDAIEDLKREHREATLWTAQDRGRSDAGVVAFGRELEALSRDLGKLRDGFHRHAGAPGHRPSGPDTTA